MTIPEITELINAVGMLMGATFTGVLVLIKVLTYLDGKASPKDRPPDKIDFNS